MLSQDDNLLLASSRQFTGVAGGANATKTSPKGKISNAPSVPTSVTFVSSLSEAQDSQKQTNVLLRLLQKACPHFPYFNTDKSAGPVYCVPHIFLSSLCNHAVYLLLLPILNARRCCVCRLMETLWRLCFALFIKEPAEVANILQANCTSIKHCRAFVLHVGGNCS